MKRLLVIGYVWPEPASSAAGSHILSLIQVFKDTGWDITFASPASKSDYQFDLASVGIATETIKLNCDSFNDFCSKLNPSAVLFDRFMMEEQFGWRVERACPDAVRILDTEDLQCLRDARFKLVKQHDKSELTVNDTIRDSREFSPEEALSPGFQHLSDLALREIAAIFRCDLSLIISQFEHQWLREKFHVPDQQLLHIPFLVETLETDFSGYESRQHFVSIGNFRHAPNWDSVLQLKQLWPKIREQLPKAELHIYGAYTPPKATALHDEKSGFLIKDRAEDAKGVIRSAKVLLAPLRFGAGIKGKLMDAMLVGTPSVTTLIGAEGMQKQDAWPGAVVKTEAGFIAQAIELYEHEGAWLEAQNKALPTLQANFDYAYFKEKLNKTVGRILDNLQSHRSELFFNSMLRFHTMRSTEFMSRWIDLKSKLNVDS